MIFLFIAGIFLVGSTLLHEQVVAQEAQTTVFIHVDVIPIETGNRADLILLPNNPLEDVTHTQVRQGVMVRGQYFTQAELDKMVDEFVATY